MALPRLTTGRSFADILGGRPAPCRSGSAVISGCITARALTAPLLVPGMAVMRSNPLRSLIETEVVLTARGRKATYALAGTATPQVHARVAIKNALRSDTKDLLGEFS